MEIAIAVIALAIALWQLKLQRAEIRLNSRITSLIHIADLLRAKIDHHEQIIENMKAKNQDWTGHARRVNGELRPLLAAVNHQLVESVANDAEGIDLPGIRQALRLNGDNGA